MLGGRYRIPAETPPCHRAVIGSHRRHDAGNNVKGLGLECLGHITLRCLRRDRHKVAGRSGDGVGERAGVGKFQKSGWRWWLDFT